MKARKRKNADERRARSNNKRANQLILGTHRTGDDRCWFLNGVIAILSPLSAALPFDKWVLLGDHDRRF